MRPRKSVAWRLGAGLGILLGCACAPLFVQPAVMPIQPGIWEGRTLQQQPITFIISKDGRIVSVTVGYSFGGCLGVFSAATDVPLPASAAPRALLVVPARAEAGSPRTVLRFQFRGGDHADGQVEFYYPCGTSFVTWYAVKTRRSR